MRADTKVVVIIGPTASGKSSFGVRLARDFKGEIISGDSIQIYRGLDIGSAKIKEEEMQGIPHYLIDIREPDEHYSVKEFQELAREKIEDISSRHKLPLIVGGTGLYIKACVYDFEFFDEDEKDDPFDELSNEQIYEKLKVLDPDCLEKIHINNRKRLVRALNVAMKHSVGISKIKERQEHKPIYDVKIIGLTADKEILYKRLDERVDQMVKDGLISEIDSLLKNGISFDAQSMQGIGYKEFRPFFEGQCSLEECVEQVKKNTRHFAKRQYTYFRNQLNVEWHDDVNEAYESVRNWLGE